MNAQPVADAFQQDVGDEANAFARNYPDHDLATLADAFEAQLAHYGRGAAFGRAVAAELRQRHEAGTRFVIDESGDDDEAAWTQATGSWQPIGSAPRDQRVDLWIDIFELDGELVENCWWNAAALIPDWYRAGEDGRPELAAPIFGHASFWKARDATPGPVDDGGPGLLARTNVADDAAHWPDAMRARYEHYLQAAEAGEADPALLKRGVTSRSPSMRTRLFPRPERDCL